ncbi:MAG TPA: UDP-N-acetylglucosamine 2-epimerase (non-hydrolyzing), partial [Candidatus Limosilactobacillus intestinavium]|nr:UDP-N-acetylglucosamine 2-epimerase (non-hydrolyzing) [Candidatus Limosilactobacillus intestinavium]
MGQLRIMTLFGTRAEVIKMAPIIKLMKQDPDTFEPVIVVASKQYQQLHQAMSLLGIESDFDLNVKSSAEIGMI